MRLGSVRTEIHTSTETAVRYYGAVRCRVDTFTSSLAEETGVRVRDFAPALWEWIPYSFLVDYFTNIGDLIEAAAFPKSDIAWCSRAYVNTNIRDGSRMTFSVNNAQPWPVDLARKRISFFPSSIIIRRKYIRRTRNANLSLPSFQLEIPGMKNYKKYLNIGALVASKGMRR
jgi:hypothetical protein